MNISKNVSIDLKVSDEIRKYVVNTIINHVSILDIHGLSDREWYQNRVTDLINKLGNEVNHPQFGKYTKRIRKQFKKTFGIVLDDSIISSIGKYLSDRTGKQKLHVVVSDDLQFEEGIFGDRGACFHNGRSWSKALLMELNANVMFIFSEEGYPLSRNWIIPTEDNGYLLINIYNNKHKFMSFFVASQCFKTAINTDIEPREIKVLWRDLYVNGSTGWFFSSCSDIIEYLIPITVSSLKYKKGDYKTCKQCGELVIASKKTKCPNCRNKIMKKVCCNCEEPVSEDEYHEHEGEIYCDDCFDRMFSYCECCDSYHDVDYFYRVANDYVCERCYNEYYSTCSCCDEIHYTENMTCVNDDMICEYCLEHHFDLCVHCNEYFPKNEGIEYDSEMYCEDCSEKLFLFCEECNEVINPKYDEYFQNNHHIYCENCRDNFCEKCQHCDEWYELKDFEEIENEGIAIRSCYNCVDDILSQNIVSENVA